MKDTAYELALIVIVCACFFIGTVIYHEWTKPQVRVKVVPFRALHVVH